MANFKVFKTYIKVGKHEKNGKKWKKEEINKNEKKSAKKTLVLVAQHF